MLGLTAIAGAALDVPSPSVTKPILATTAATTGLTAALAVLISAAASATSGGSFALYGTGALASVMGASTTSVANIYSTVPAGPMTLRVSDARQLQLTVGDA